MHDFDYFQSKTAICQIHRASRPESDCTPALPSAQNSDQNQKNAIQIQNLPTIVKWVYQIFEDEVGYNEEHHKKDLKLS